MGKVFELFDLATDFLTATSPRTITMDKMKVVTKKPPNNEINANSLIFPPFSLDYQKERELPAPLN